MKDELDWRAEETEADPEWKHLLGMLVLWGAITVFMEGAMVSEIAIAMILQPEPKIDWVFWSLLAHLIVVFACVARYGSFVRRFKALTEAE